MKEKKKKTWKKITGLNIEQKVFKSYKALCEKQNGEGWSNVVARS